MDYPLGDTPSFLYAFLVEAFGEGSLATGEFSENMLIDAKTGFAKAFVV